MASDELAVLLPKHDPAFTSAMCSPIATVSALNATPISVDSL